MKKNSTVFLRVVLVLMGIGAGAILFWFPNVEGRNVNSTLFEVYFRDPFLAYAYLASLPFFIALYQAFRLLRFISQNRVFSLPSVKALRNIKYCAMSIIVFIVGAEGYFFIVQHGKDDIAGGVVMGLFLIFTTAVVASAAALFEKLLQSAVELKSENDLTV